MTERTQDAMTYVRDYGRPYLFLTMTCNPSWKDMTEEMFENQSPYDGNDIIARVFRLKLKAFQESITKGHLFGEVGCHMQTIEWQKRGLPHVHALFWLKDAIRPDEIEYVISAEIPDIDTDPILHALVIRHMIHGPCGALNPSSPCMKSGKCTKGFPKQLVQETQTDVNGYPRYRRRAPMHGGNVAVIRVGNRHMDIDNRWVVPYNAVLLRTFHAHINVEYSSSVKAIKYITKYINKGTDQAVFHVDSEEDEVLRYQTGRYVSSSKAVWRILNFPVQERHQPVIQLTVHLQN